MAIRTGVIVGSACRRQRVRRAGCPDENAVAAFIHGQVSVGSSLAIDEHLDRCTNCRRVVSTLARLLREK